MIDRTGRIYFVDLATGPTILEALRPAPRRSGWIGRELRRFGRLEVRFTAQQIRHEIRRRSRREVEDLARSRTP